MAKNEIAKIEEQSTAVAETTNTLQVNIEQKDMMIPFLKVVQSLSEEVTPGKDKYNPDVRPGDLYDSVTRTIFKDAKTIICGIKKYFAEWTPEVRGQLIAKHDSNSPVVLSAKKVERKTEKGNPFYSLKTEDDHDLIETYGIVMLIKNEEGLTLPAVLTLAKTSFLVGKQLTTLLAIHQSKGVPIFRIGTTSTSNAKGSWFKPSFAFDSYETDESTIEIAKGIAAITDSILFRNTDIEVENADNTINETIL